MVNIKKGIIKRFVIIILTVVIYLPFVFASEQNFVMDANGNLVSGDGFCRTYNGLNQLSAVYSGDECSGTPLETYEWHPLEDRIVLRDIYHPNGTLRETIYYPWKETVAIQNSSGTFYQHFVYQDGVLVGFEDTDGKKYYVLPDHLGSPNVILDENGNVVEEYFFSPFGEIIVGGDVSRYSFTGKEFFETTGEFDFNARRYRADLARFIQPDPMVQNPFDPQSLNRYAYARNNPYKYIDPDGRNYRVFLNERAANIIDSPGDDSGLGHIAVGVDNPNSPGQQIVFENYGIGENIQGRSSSVEFNTENRLDRYIQSLVGDHQAQTSAESIGTNKIPEGYTDYYEVEQDVEADKAMIKKGLELTEDPGTYNAIFSNSQQHTASIIRSGGGSYYLQNLPLPTTVFELNKKTNELRSSLGGGSCRNCFVTTSSELKNIRQRESQKIADALFKRIRSKR